MAATKTDRVSDALRSAIAAGQLKPGDRLPTESDLAGKHQVGIATARAAVARLVNQGLVRTEHGRGSYVQDQSRIDRCASRSLTAGEGPAHIHIAFADAEIAGRLGLSEGTEILVRRQTLQEGGRPAQHVTSYYPRGLAKGTAIESPGPESDDVVAALESAGRDVASQREEVDLSRATGEEASALDLPEGSPCLRAVRTVSDSEGTALAVVAMTFIDRYRLIYDIPSG